MMDLQEIEKLKNEYNSIKEYSEKLKWWDKNILKNYLSDNKKLPDLYFPLTIQHEISRGSFVLPSLGKNHSYINEITINIFPENENDKKLFWDWIFNKKYLMLNSEDWNTHYMQILNNKDEHIKLKIIENEFQLLKSDDEVLSDIGSVTGDHRYYNNGRESAMYKKIEDMKLFYHSGQPGGGANRGFNYFLKGYRNILKETALLKIKSEMENKTIETETESPYNKNLTIEQAVMIFEYIFHELKTVENSTKKSELISFLTGFSIEGLRKKHSGKSEKNYISNLQLIRPYFESLQMENILQRINNELANKVE